MALKHLPATNFFGYRSLADYLNMKLRLGQLSEQIIWKVVEAIFAKRVVRKRGHSAICSYCLPTSFVVDKTTFSGKYPHI